VLPNPNGWFKPSEFSPGSPSSAALAHFTPFVNRTRKAVIDSVNQHAKRMKIKTILCTSATVLAALAASGQTGAAGHATVAPTAPPVTSPAPGASSGGVVNGPILAPRQPTVGTMPGQPGNVPQNPAGTVPQNPAGTVPQNPAGTTPQNPTGNAPGSPNAPITPGAPNSNQAVTPADHAILGHIGQSLQRMNLLNGLQVSFLVQNGFVTMVGTVPTIGAGQQLEGLIAQVPGVLGINNQLQVMAQGNGTGFINTAPPFLPAPGQPANQPATMQPGSPTQPGATIATTPTPQ
jgi:hypothetical protein